MMTLLVSAEHAAARGDDALVGQRLDHHLVDHVTALLFEAPRPASNLGSNIDEYLTDAVVLAAAGLSDATMWGNSQR